MVMIWRSLTLVAITLALMWVTVLLGWYQPFSWQYSIRVIAGLYFLLAVFTSGLMSLPTTWKRRREKGVYQREDWSFIFLLVTVLLFGVSLAFT
ncbi:hypothetical protein [Desmospora profundinema]|uniref:Uncharacterized protein YhhL (DUF1145 family) n=1 Tax=Desmospora profundinema TaxID=1571184 RepID=A0ABU1IN92_9BACL|nr:hypothetical protein [Desmospora profundinema]MDR6225873.1 uncharacterized protein YhhL (DUF1145 family) [Desmospora profundinema]